MCVPAWISTTSSSNWALRRSADSAKAAHATSLRSAARGSPWPRSARQAARFAPAAATAPDPLLLESDRGNAGARDQRVFARLHAAHADCAEALPSLHDWHAAFEHAP